MLILIAGTVRMGQRSRQASDEAVRTVSLLYLDELAGRREQVVADNLQRRVADMRTALELMTEDDLSDMTHLRAYQAKMKLLFTLQKFAFIDEKGLIYTSLGTQTDLEEYGFDHLSIDGPEISVKNLKEATQAGVAERTNKARLKGRRVLLAEDVAINAEIMKMALQTREIEVDLAENGRIAVEKFTGHPSGYYDAILMDIRMPEMDGLEATRAIRAAGREDSGTIPIIALTANAFDEDVQRSLQAGLNAHLAKPVRPDVLLETLETLITD